MATLSNRRNDVIDCFMTINHIQETSLAEDLVVIGDDETEAIASDLHSLNSQKTFQRYMLCCCATYTKA